MKYKVLVMKKNDYSYDRGKLYNWIKEGLDFIWGEDYFQNKNKVLIKPNLLMEAEPNQGITTHPNFIIALASVLKDKGVEVFLADNPSGFGENKSIKEIYFKLGLQKHPDLFTLLFNDKPPFKKDNFSFSWWVDYFDEIINLPKLKTHDLLVITSAVKNTYGFIPGIIKAKLHREYPKPVDFAKIIVKIWQLFQPKVNILDGIISLEAEGPAKKGIPKKRGLMLFSNSALALDYVLAKLIKIEPKKIPYLKIALQEKILDISSLEIYPQDWKNLAIDDFIFGPSSILEKIPSPFLRSLGSFLKSKPYIDNKICRKCKKCIQVCPAKAIYIGINEKMAINYRKCIMCMCCQEVCSWAAVGLKHSFILRFLSKFSK